MLSGWCCRRTARQLMPHVRFQVPFLGLESQLKSGFACAGLCSSGWLMLPLKYPFLWILSCPPCCLATAVLCGHAWPWVCAPSSLLGDRFFRQRVSCFCAKPGNSEVKLNSTLQNKTKPKRGSCQNIGYKITILTVNCANSCENFGFIFPWWKWFLYLVASTWTKQGWRPKCPTHQNQGYGTCSENHTGKIIGFKNMFPNGLGNTNLGQTIHERGKRKPTINKLLLWSHVVLHFLFLICEAFHVTIIFDFGLWDFWRVQRIVEKQTEEFCDPHRRDICLRIYIYIKTGRVLGGYIVVYHQSYLKICSFYQHSEIIEHFRKHETKSSWKLGC